jgi:ATP-dependent Clp protease ATP-binding subunit ClpA
MRQWLANKGFDPKFGARPLKRLIQKEIKSPLVEEILFGKLSRGGKVKITLHNDKPFFEIYDSIST